MIAACGFSQRNITIASLSLAIGIGFTSSSETGIWSIFPEIIQSVFAENVVAVVFVVAVILSLVLPKDMGAFKPLMPLWGKTLIENTVDSVLNGGAEAVTVVVGYRGDELAELLTHCYGDLVQIVWNPNYAQTDMLYSIRLGCMAMPSCSAFFLLPGDMPVVRQNTFRRLLDGRQYGKIVFPTLEGHCKHPPLIDSSLIPEILSFQGKDGLRSLWREHEEDIWTVAVDDEGVWLDLDTPTAYYRCRQRYELQDRRMTAMEQISQSVVKKDHTPKMSGQAVYVDDYPGEGVLTGKMLRSRYARARVLDVKVPPLPVGYFYVDRRDVPGDNNVNIVLDDTPVYASRLFPCVLYNFTKNAVFFSGENLLIPAICRIYFLFLML